MPILLSLACGMVVLAFVFAIIAPGDNRDVLLVMIFVMLLALFFLVLQIALLLIELSP